MHTHPNVHKYIRPIYIHVTTFVQIPHTHYIYAKIIYAQINIYIQSTHAYMYTRICEYTSPRSIASWLRLFQYVWWCDNISLTSPSASSPSLHIPRHCSESVCMVGSISHENETGFSKSRYLDCICVEIFFGVWTPPSSIAPWPQIPEGFQLVYTAGWRDVTPSEDITPWERDMSPWKAEGPSSKASARESLNSVYMRAT